MFGNNPIRKQDMDAWLLHVQDIFLTLQGEGPHSGVPAVFIRLAGCNLQCHFCDTDFETNYDNVMDVTRILYRVGTLTKDTGTKLIVLTGGEPMRQNLAGLVAGLTDLHYQVQIETAGTLWQDGLEPYLADGRVQIVCSPKTPKINPKIAEWCWHWKYIITADETDPVDGLPIMSTQVFGMPARIYRPLSPLAADETVWVQPCDAGGNLRLTRANEEAAVAVAIKHGYRLSYQVHKALQLP